MCSGAARHSRQEISLGRIGAKIIFDLSGFTEQSSYLNEEADYLLCFFL